MTFILHRARMLALTTLIALPATLTGCTSLGGPVVGTGASLPYPSWVKEGTHLSRDAQDKALFGLGEVRGIRNVALARSTADNRARAELARLLDAFVVQWLKGCPQPAESNAAQNQDVLLKLITASNLSGVQIVEHYFHPKDGAVFSLARLELSHMVQHLQLTPEVTSAVKTCLANSSEVAYGRLLNSKNP